MFIELLVTLNSGSFLTGSFRKVGAITSFRLLLLLMIDGKYFGQVHIMNDLNNEPKKTERIDNNVKMEVFRIVWKASSQ